MNVIDPKDLAAAMGPMLDKLKDEAMEQLASTVIPAIGVQLQEGIKTAIAGLNTDSKEAITALMDRVDDMPDKLEAAGERLIDKFFTRLQSTSLTLGGKQ